MHVKRIIAAALTCCLLVSVCVFDATPVSAQNRYYYKTETSKVYEKYTYTKSRDKKTKKDWALYTGKYFVNGVTKKTREALAKKGIILSGTEAIPYLSLVFGVYDIMDYCYWDMSEPGKLKATYYYKTKYEYDRLKKKPRRLVEKKEYVTFTLYIYDKDKKTGKYNWKKYNSHSQVLTVKGGGKD